MKSISQILNEILGGIDPLCSTAEVAGVCDTTPRTVGNWKSGNTTPDFKQVKHLSHYLIEKYNYCDLAMQMFPSFVGRSNGKVRDDLINLYNYGADLDRSFGKGNKQESQTAFHKMELEMKDLEQEIKDME